MWNFQPLSSVLEGQSRRPSMISGLFLIGPRKPLGRGSLSLQVLPPSFDLQSHPVQSATFRPTLKNSQSSPLGISQRTGFQQALRRWLAEAVPLRMGPSEAGVLSALMPAISASFVPNVNTPSAARMGLLHSLVPFFLMLTQMQTSGLRSCLPPK